MRARPATSQCETTQVREQGKGAALFGYTSLYGSVPGGQAEYLRVPQAQFGPIKVARTGPDERYLYPVRHPADRLAGREVRGRPRTAARWPCSGSARSASSAPGSAGTSGGRVIGVDLVPERLRDGRSGTASRRSTSTSVDDVPGALIELIDGRGPDAVIDAVGMEAHGVAGTRQVRPDAPPGCCRTRWPQKMIDKAGVDRLDRAARRDQGACAAAARCRSAASTAARPTRCR